MRVIMSEIGSDKASFGFREVPEAEKAGLVREVFDSVAPKYDLMNDLMSVGLHRVWKTVLIDRLNPQPGETLLDVAGGTGDIAAAFLARADGRPHAAIRPRAGAIIADINVEMLLAGRRRDRAPGAVARMALLCADAERLPLPDQSVDAYAIAFGIRNVTHIDAALAEARRVLKPGGEVRFATDWANYAEWTLWHFTRDARFAWLAERADDWRKPWPGHVTTRYEAKRLGDCAPVWLRFLRR